MNTLSAYKEPVGTRVLVRVDYNVPLKGSKIVDARRIESSYVTLDTLLKKGATPIVLAHLGDGTESLRPIATFLSKRYNIVFVTNDLYDPRTQDIISQVPRGTIVLLENIRRYEGEEKNAKAFARVLAGLGSIYVNDAFSASHRPHASIVGVAKLLPRYAGKHLEQEINALTRILTTTQHPFLFILGGAKFATKIPLIARFDPMADNFIIGGAILNSFYKVAGFAIGESVAEDGYEKPIKKLLANEKLLLPVDVMVERGGKKVICTPDEVLAHDVIVDIGPQSITLITHKIAKAKVVVWNGPMGWYEKGFTKGTRALAAALVSSKARAVIGGGDTGAALEKVLAGSENKRIFVSTGGGATLDFLSRGTLPGIDVLK